jgi:HK97 family phage prohead protease
MQEKIIKQFEIKNLGQLNDELGYFEADLAVYGNIDYGNDIIEKGAFGNINSNQKFPLLADHDTKLVIGHYFADSSNPDALKIKGYFNFARDPETKALLVPKAGEKYANLKSGDISGFSVGFSSDKKGMEIKEVNGERIRVMTKGLVLKEGSVVTFPMNDKARLNYIKTVNPTLDFPLAPRDTKWDASEAEKRIREYSESGEEPAGDYQRYFMYFDNGRSKFYDAYKLPFVDIINGEPHIVPNAISAIAGVLKGARAGVNIDEAQKAKIKEHINNIYERMAKEFNDEGIVSLFKTKSLEEIQDVRDVEEILKDYGFSSKGAKTIISKIKSFKEVDSRDEEKPQDEVIEERDADLETLSNSVSTLERKLAFKEMEAKLEKINNLI